MPDYECPLSGRHRSCRRRHRVPVLQRVHRRQGDDARRYPQDPGAYEIRRRQLLPHAADGCSSAIISRPLPAPGPLIGPVLATQFGWAPGFMWLLAGCVLGGAVHDAITLWVSTRRGGRSLAEIARSEIGPVAGVTAIIAVLFILVVALAGLGLIVVNALAESAWGMFTIGATIPIAVFMGFYMFVWRKGAHQGSHGIGVTLMLLGVVFGKNFAESSFGPSPRADAAPDHGGDGHLRLRRVRHSGLDAADAALVPQHLHEDRRRSCCWPLASSSRTRRSRRRPSRSSSAEAARSSPVRSSPSCSSPSPAARSPASTRSSRPARRRRWWTRKPTSARSATWACCSKGWSA